MAIPTKAQWRARTASRLPMRGGHNPELLDIDRLLDLYEDFGTWTRSVEPLIRIRKKIAEWEARRDLQGDRDDSGRKPAMEGLRGEVEARLGELVRDVAQCEYTTLTGNDGPRFIITTGLLSCIVVVLFDRVSRVATLAHLQEKNEAVRSIDIMLQASAGLIPIRAEVTLAGGRRTINDDKLAALIKALTDKGIHRLKIGQQNTLRDPNSRDSLNFAFDRHTGASNSFPAELVPEAEKWNLRTRAGLARAGAEASKSNQNIPVVQSYQR